MAWGFGNSGAAGGGGLNRHDALLRVQAPAHSVVTITKGAYHKSDVGHENADDHTLYDYYFIIHQSQFDSVNPWTVTATLGEKTRSDTVIIDMADEYDVVLTYWLSLYSAGQTSGWNSKGMWNGASGDGVQQQQKPTLTYNEDNLLIRQSGGSGNGHGIAYSETVINCALFKTAKITWTANWSTGTGSRIGIIRTSATNYNQNLANYDFPSASKNTIITSTLDLSNIDTDGCWLVIQISRYSSNSATCNIYDIELEYN